jgi:SSS family solute:Na+ symporter
MHLHIIDLAIIGTYLLLTLLIGVFISKRASKNIKSYFLSGNKIPWYVLGVSNASSMFDITHIIWLVSFFVVYGMKSMWIP